MTSRLSFSTAPQTNSLNFGGKLFIPDIPLHWKIALALSLIGLLAYLLKRSLETPSAPFTLHPLLLDKRVALLDDISPLLRNDKTAIIFDKFKKKVSKGFDFVIKVGHKFHDLHDRIAFLTDEVLKINNPSLTQKWKDVLFSLNNSRVFLKNPSLRHIELILDLSFEKNRLDGNRIEYTVENLSEIDEATAEQNKQLEFESFFENPIPINHCVIALDNSTHAVLGAVKYKKISGQFVICSIARRAFAARCGIGTNLLIKAIELIKLEDQEQNTPIVLQVRKSNSYAIKCYQKLGFTKVKELAGYYNHSHYPEDAYEMQYSPALP